MKIPQKSGTQEVSTQSEIVSSKLLLVEGMDEVYFFEQLLKELSLEDHIQIISIDGIEKLKTKIKTIINMPKFDRVEAMGIVRDSDGSASSAFQSVKDILADIGYPVPSVENEFVGDGIRIGIYIIPGNGLIGNMLEDLCLLTKDNDQNIGLINDFLDKLRTEGSSYPRNIAKAKCQIYLATQSKVVNTIGLGAKKGYWNFQHTSLTHLKDFLLKM